jgi:hypothetical protein
MKMNAVEAAIATGLYERYPKKPSAAAVASRKMSS